MGKLISVDSKEVVKGAIASDTLVLVHAPRYSFRVCAYNEIE